MNTICLRTIEKKRWGVVAPNVENSAVLENIAELAEFVHSSHDHVGKWQKNQREVDEPAQDNVLHFCREMELIGLLG